MLFIILVAGTGIEPVSRGYEPRELPLLYPAMYADNFLTSINKPRRLFALLASLELPLLYPAIPTLKSYVIVPYLSLIYKFFNLLLVCLLIIDS